MSKVYSIHALFEARATLAALRHETRLTDPAGGTAQALYYLQRAQTDLRDGPLLRVVIPILRRAHSADEVLTVSLDETLGLRVVFHEPVEDILDQPAHQFADVLKEVRWWLKRQESLEGIYVPDMPELLPARDAGFVKAILDQLRTER